MGRRWERRDRRIGPRGPLLTVKQAIPPVRAGAVPRERLERLLRDTADRLTVVVAPAGWGKTSLLSRWAADPAEHAPHRLGVARRERRRAGPVLELRADRAATGERRDRHRPRSTRSPRPAADPMDLALPMLLNELAASSGQHVLVLDDYHVITDPRIHEAVEFLVAYLPPTLRMVIAGRSDPPLPLARMRARGELTELRADELRFSRDESAALLSAVSGRELDAGGGRGGVGADRRAGRPGCSWPVWPCGRRAEPTTRAGSAATTGTCSTTSPPRCCPPWRRGSATCWCGPRRWSCCPARCATPRCRSTGSAEVLAELERADLFVVALDGEREWYRCHRLLRDVLLREPRQTARRARGPAPCRGLVRGAGPDRRRGPSPAAGRATTTRPPTCWRNAETWFFERGAAATYLQLGERLPDRGRRPAAGAVAGLRGGAERATGPGAHWLDVCERRDRTGHRRSPAGAAAGRRAVLAGGLRHCRTPSPRGRSRWRAGGRAGDRGRRRRATRRPAGAGQRAGPRRPVRRGRAGSWSSCGARETAIGWSPGSCCRSPATLGLSLLELGRGDEVERLLREARPLADAAERDWARGARPWWRSCASPRGGTAT